MAAKKKAEPTGMAIPAYEPTTSIRVTKAQAGEVAVGDQISLKVTGTVRGARKSYDNEHYEIELEKAAVSEISGNAADKAMKEQSEG